MRNFDSWVSDPCLGSECKRPGSRTRRI